MSAVRHGTGEDVPWCIGRDRAARPVSPENGVYAAGHGGRVETGDFQRRGTSSGVRPAMPTLLRWVGVGR